MDTDTQVFEDIVAEFKGSPVLHYAQLHLQVQDGVVTISGRVNSLAERNAVERAAKRVVGIKTLILEVRAAAIPRTVTDRLLNMPKPIAF
jgi:osmotically-inducible protein OsmY